MQKLLTGPFETPPRFIPRAVWARLGWGILSLITLLASMIDVKGLYPDWDYESGRLFGLFIQAALIIAWSTWILWILFRRDKRLHAWFRLGMCLAFGLGMVRLFFMGEVIRLLTL
jgi:hypothetical protein